MQNSLDVVVNNSRQYEALELILAFPTATIDTDGDSAMQSVNLEVSGLDDLETLRELNLNYIRSVRESDVQWFDENLSEDFLNSNPDCSLIDRAAFLQQIAPPCPVANLAVEDVRIRILGDTSIIHARTTYLKPDGQAATGRYTDVWMRQRGRWVCVAAHVGRG